MEGDGHFLASIEAINFDATIFDTDDLSTIRGASWAALAVTDHFTEWVTACWAGRARVASLYSGASRAACRMSGAGLDANGIRSAILDLLSGNPPDTAAPLKDWRHLVDVLPQLRFSVAVVPDQGEDADRCLRNALAVRQYRMLDVDLPAPLAQEDRHALLCDKAGKIDSSLGPAIVDATFPCAIDGMRPVEAYFWRSDPQGKRARRDVAVSGSVAARKSFGRTGRRDEFYHSYAGLEPTDQIFLADSFEEIAREGALPETVPEAAIGKMCVLSMDGNDFSGLRNRFLAAAGDRLLAEKNFSDLLREKRQLLLKGIVDLFRDPRHAELLQLENPKKKWIDVPESEDGWIRRTGSVLRFETLLWGADESMFVFPAWALSLVLTRLAELLADKEIVEIALSRDKREVMTYGIGLVVCNYKTPIRALKDMAGRLEENSKNMSKKKSRNAVYAGCEGRTENFLDILVLGGVDLPVRKLTDEREEVYGIPENRQDFVFPIPLADVPDMLRRFSRVRGVPGDPETGVSRRKLLEIRDKAIQAGCLSDSLSSQDCIESGRETDVDRLFARLKVLLEDGLGTNEEPDADGRRAELRNFLSGDTFAWCAEAPLAPLLHLGQLWNYLLPNEDEAAKMEPAA